MIAAALEKAERRRAQHRLHRSARHRHRAGRPDRDRGLEPGLRAVQRGDCRAARSARSRRTSAIWRRPPASSASARCSCRCSTASSCRRCIPAQLNEFIDFAHSPFYVVSSSWKTWTAEGGRRRAAAAARRHQLLRRGRRERPRHPRELRGRRRVQDDAAADGLIFPLSARNEEQLREAAPRLREFLASTHPRRLDDIAFTLQHRTEVLRAPPGDRRRRTRGRLLDKLQPLPRRHEATTTSSSATSRTPRASRKLLNRKEKEQFVELLAQARDPHKLAQLWTDGLLSDWQGLQRGRGQAHLPADLSVRRQAPLDRTGRSAPRCRSQTRGRRAASADRQQRIDVRAPAVQEGLPRPRLLHLRPPGLRHSDPARRRLSRSGAQGGRDSPPAGKVRKIRTSSGSARCRSTNGAPNEVVHRAEAERRRGAVRGLQRDARARSSSTRRASCSTRPTQEAPARRPSTSIWTAIRARCTKVDRRRRMPIRCSSRSAWRSGRASRCCRRCYKNDDEVLGALKLPEFRAAATSTSSCCIPRWSTPRCRPAMGAQLGDAAGEMYVPYSIGEVEILHPLTRTCYSYVTEAKGESRRGVERVARERDSSSTRRARCSRASASPSVCRCRACMRSGHRSARSPASDGGSTAVLRARMAEVAVARACRAA